MEKVMDFLFKLNNKLYSIKIHAIISILWIWSVLNFHNILTLWFKAGIASWFLLILWRWKQDKWTKKHFQEQWAKRRETGILPYLVGLNIAVLFGPISIVLAVVSDKMGKTQDTPRK